MKKFFSILLILFFLALIIKVNFISAKSISIKDFSEKNNNQALIEINFFYSAACPHCQKEEKFLDILKEKYPTVEIIRYEVISHPENRRILSDFYEKYKVPSQERGLVPIIFTPTKYFVGFNNQVAENIEACLKECLNKENVPQKFNIPFLGPINPSKVSLPLLTLVLGVLDGFNPCAMWILIVLISLLLSLHSRKKIALIGGIFIFAEGLLYFLFMTAWLNAFLLMGYVSITKIAIGLFGIIFGIWRIRDFVVWKPGVCKVTDHSGSGDKVKLRMEKILESKKLPVVLFGVIALAFSVNLIEFFCSAGFPVIYTRILALQHIGRFQYYLYLFFYNILYMLDDIVVFAFAFFTLSRFNFSDRYNRYSTLIAGLLILALGIILIFKPGLLMFD